MTTFKFSSLRKTTIFLPATMLSVSATALDFDQTQRLANQGDAIAQFDLGEIYEDGNGVNQDYAKAFEWYQKAANQGDARAQFKLGAMYEKGEGVRQNIVAAKEYFGRACDNEEQKGCDNYRTLSQ